MQACTNDQVPPRALRWERLPQRLIAEEIPLPARIVAVADAYDAMVSRRIYRSRSHSPTEVIGELMSRAGSQFDAEVVAALGRVAVQ